MLNRLLIGRSEKARQAHLVCAASLPPFLPWASGAYDEVTEGVLNEQNQGMCRQPAHNVWIVWRLTILFRPPCAFLCS
jgi:hypothetical protein